MSQCAGQACPQPRVRAPPPQLNRPVALRQTRRDSYATAVIPVALTPTRQFCDGSASWGTRHGDAIIVPSRNDRDLGLGSMSDEFTATARRVVVSVVGRLRSRPEGDLPLEEHEPRRADVRA